MYKYNLIKNLKAEIEDLRTSLQKICPHENYLFTRKTYRFGDITTTCTQNTEYTKTCTICGHKAYLENQLEYKWEEAVQTFKTTERAHQKAIKRVARLQKEMERYKNEHAN